MKTQFLIGTLILACSLPIPGFAADKYQEGEVTNGGTISGKVTFTGEDPPPKLFKVTKDIEVCGTDAREIDFVAVNNGALTGVVVYLDKVKSGKPFPPELSKATIDQKNCEFRPFLQVMRNGSDLTAINDDPILHNIHTYEILGRAKKTVFNVSQSKPGTLKKKVNLKRGDALKVECDAHDFMHGFVFVAKNPYYAVVDENGHFTIQDIPPGEYTVKAWHGSLRGQKKKVKVDAGSTVTVDFQFKGR